MFQIWFELGQGENESVCYIARKVIAVTSSLLSDSRGAGVDWTSDFHMQAQVFTKRGLFEPVLAA